MRVATTHRGSRCALHCQRSRCSLPDTAPPPPHGHGPAAQVRSGGVTKIRYRKADQAKRRKDCVDRRPLLVALPSRSGCPSGRGEGDQKRPGARRRAHEAPRPTAEKKDRKKAVLAVEKAQARRPVPLWTPHASIACRAHTRGQPVTHHAAPSKSWL